jgi:hypothetical protein
MKSNRIVYYNVIVCVLLMACGALAPFAQPTSTPTLMPTLTSTVIPTATLTLTPLPPTETQMPARPAAPANLEITYTCKKLVQFKRSYDVTINLTWEDKSDNEVGFEILKNRVLIETVKANVTEFIDFFDVDKYGEVSYAVQAFNDAGKSGRVTKELYYTCK